MFAKNNIFNILVVVIYFLLSYLLVSYGVSLVFLSLSLCVLTVILIMLNFANNFVIVLCFAVASLLTHTASLANLYKTLINPSIIVIFSSFFLSVLFYYSNLANKIIYFILSKVKSSYYLFLSLMVTSFFLSSIMNHTTAALIMFSLLFSFFDKLDSSAVLKIKTNTLIGVTFASLLGANVMIISSPSSIYAYNYIVSNFHYHPSIIKYSLIAFPISLLLVIIISLFLYFPIKTYFEKIDLIKVKEVFITYKVKGFKFIDYSFIVIFILFTIGVNFSFVHIYYTLMIILCSSVLLLHLKNVKEFTKSILKLPYNNLLLIFIGLLISLIIQKYNIFNLVDFSFIASLSFYAKCTLFLIAVMVVTEFILNSPALAIVMPVFIPVFISSHLLLLTFLATLAANSAAVLPQSTPSVSILWKQDINTINIIKYGTILKLLVLIMGIFAIVIA